MRKASEKGQWASTYVVYIELLVLMMMLMMKMKLKLVFYSKLYIIKI